jgi:hypothetical protein
MTGKNTGPLATQAAQNAGQGSTGTGTANGDGQNSGTSLLEEDADNIDGGNTGGEGQQNGQQDGTEGAGTQQGGSLDVDAVVDQLEKRLGERFDAIADRRVNALLKQIRKHAVTDDPAAGGQTAPVQQPGAAPAPPQGNAPAQPAAALVRATRTAARDFLTDELKFISSEEREFAYNLVSTLAQARCVGDVDDEALGKEIAGEVATTVKNLRKHYEDRTVAALRNRGALVQVPAQPKKSGEGGVTAQSQFDRGKEIANRFRPQPTTATSN